mmetsp:Transcript_12098/g.28060  ORF Transcript_12098/g.28060 Transcript_12098/m.28060 type:complete len:236 (-) Transcript_12098:971-1678(-)
MVSSPKKRRIGLSPPTKVERPSDSSAMAESKFAFCPSTAAAMRPPSRLPMGRSCSALTMVAVKPTITSGCTVTAGAVATAGKTACAAEPRRSDDCNSALGTTGIRSVVPLETAVAAEAATVEALKDASSTAVGGGTGKSMERSNPTTYSPRPTQPEKQGPANAKSKSAVRLRGKERIWVMAPKRPSCSDGRKIGMPVRTPCTRAAARCATSWSNCIPPSAAASGMAIWTGAGSPS